MASEAELQKFMDCRTSTDEGRRLLDELKNDGNLGEFLLGEAAAALMESPNLFVDELSSDDVADDEALHARTQSLTVAQGKRNASYIQDDDDSYSVAAEPDAPYGE